MPIEYKDLENKKPFEKLAILEVGEEKSGKSWCAATAPKPILFLDFDLRADALAGRAGVYAITYRDPESHMQPTAFCDMLDTLTKLEQGADFRTLGIATAPEGLRPATLVLDSISTSARAAMKYALYTNKDITRTLTFGGKLQVNFVRNFDGWNAEMSSLEAVVLRCLAMPFNFVSTLHEVDEETGDSTPEKPKFTGKKGPYPVRYKMLFKYFNELWHFENAPSLANPASQVYLPRVQVKPDYKCPWAATAMLLDQYEQPNIEAMITKHLSREQAAKAQAEYDAILKLPQVVTP